MRLPSMGWDVCRPARVEDERCCFPVSKRDATYEQPTDAAAVFWLRTQAATLRQSSRLSIYP